MPYKNIFATPMYVVGSQVLFVLIVYCIYFKIKSKTYAAYAASLSGVLTGLVWTRILMNALSWVGLLILLAPYMLLFGLVWFFSFMKKSAEPYPTVNNKERKRILGMVESGKVSAVEGNELLEALGRSTAMQAEAKFTRSDIVCLVGISLVVLGFFLPWVNVRLNQVSSILGNRTAFQSGYQVGAVGWAVLVIAVAAALPLFITPRDYLYKITLLQLFLLSIGLVLVISLMIQAGDNLLIGLVLCLVGFIIGVVGWRTKFMQLRQ